MVDIHGPLQTRGETRCPGRVSISCLDQSRLFLHLLIFAWKGPIGLFPQISPENVLVLNCCLVMMFHELVWFSFQRPFYHTCILKLFSRASHRGSITLLHHWCLQTNPAGPSAGMWCHGFVSSSLWENNTKQGIIQYICIGILNNICITFHFKTLIWFISCLLWSSFQFIFLIWRRYEYSMIHYYLEDTKRYVF